MTQDPKIILKALLCCSNEEPSCDDCPYDGVEFHCQELMNDAAELIKSLQSTIESQNVMSDKLGQDIDIKLDYIHKLEERLGITHE